ncbi:MULTISPECIES: helix-turn-helix domain-containing protein [Methylobacterium]|uniref:Transposase IS30-like HTH domain-containing protein n=2 Tax=Pseudomonadota TaxID=1224 RepID=A0ABQ4T037_9HYPH|nr:MULTISPECIES: helix-turn-helix domain-containing protein [Methylobacterium]PIU08174.1 MAG: hypothetical protein COT56_02300 [Methylobacterium sp. CG09_land_8_20_14_0_10_71_15]PIU15684.1 MAG: hypothetical protein COT28_03550 [Methylobacterium sp. CG08_land_8_20_14_0_20_71_15]GBU17258.1 hypothetical protein AwMethylo_14730 [Methylobacterium sp.]GJE07831.1 hypothetical protein AOPFMNJM_3163 [Methylobacterium jeotgali]
MARRRLTDADIERIAEMRGRNVPMAVIGLALDCSASSVNYHCLRLGIDAPKTAKCTTHVIGPMLVQRSGHVVRRFTPEEDTRLLALEAEGLTPTEIARALGRRHNTVTARLATLARHQERLEAAG